jgi:hypothetical protein
MRRHTVRKEKRMRRNNIIIGAILLSLMVFSMFAVYFSNPENMADPNLEYNGYKLNVEDTNGGQMLTTTVNGQKYYFYTLPIEAKATIENITGVDVMKASPKIIFLTEPLGLNTQASSEQVYFEALVADVKQFSDKTIVSGISEEDTFSDKIVYTCNDASVNSPVFILRVEETYTTMTIEETEDYCYDIKSDARSLLSLRDYLIYSSLKIIE